MTLHMVEMHLDAKALLDMLRRKDLLRDDDEDLGYGVHAWLREAFGSIAPQPWRLWAAQGRPLRLLGYSHHPAEELRQALREFASPSLAAVVPDPEHDIQSKILPKWEKGRRLGFEVLTVPLGRKSSSRVEKDAYLMALDRGQPSSRDEVYRAWLLRQMGQGVRIYRLELAGFRLLKTYRRRHGPANGKPTFHRLTRPQALFRGELEVADPISFENLLAKGVGRHKAFGYGMLLLRPPRS